MNLWITTRFPLFPRGALATMGPARYEPGRPAPTLKIPAQNAWVLLDAELGVAGPPPRKPVPRPVDRPVPPVHSILVDPDPLFNRRESRRGARKPVCWHLEGFGRGAAERDVHRCGKPCGKNRKARLKGPAEGVPSGIAPGGYGSVQAFGDGGRGEWMLKTVWIVHSAAESDGGGCEEFLRRRFRRV